MEISSLSSREKEPARRLCQDRAGTPPALLSAEDVVSQGARPHLPSRDLGLAVAQGRGLGLPEAMLVLRRPRGTTCPKPGGPVPCPSPPTRCSSAWIVWSGCDAIPSRLPAEAACELPAEAWGRASSRRPSLRCPQPVSEGGGSLVGMRG